MDESGADLEVRPPAVEELEALEQRPSVLAHYVRSQGACSPTLASNRVDQHALRLLHGLLDEVKDGITRLVLRVEDGGRPAKLQKKNSVLSAANSAKSVEPTKKK